MELSHDSNQFPAQFYDLQLIHKMCRGDQAKIAKMMEVFINQTSEAIQEILAAYSEKDFSKMAKLVHKIKPTLTYFGTVALEKEFVSLEDLLLNQTEQSKIEQKIAVVDTLITEVINEMKKDFNLN